MKNILIIGFVWPEPTSTAAGNRMLQLINILQQNKYAITFASTASKSENSYNLSQLNIKSEKIELNNDSFNVLLKQINPSIVIFDRFLTEEQFGWRVAEICPNALRILDTEDLHFLRNTRKNAIKKNIPFSYDLLNNEAAHREIASIYRCDLSLIISKFEYNLLKTQFNIPKQILCYLPFLSDEISESEIKNLPTFDERLHFMTIGNFKHEPNFDAVIYLKEKIWPLIKKELPNAKLYIYGSYPTQKILKLHNEKQGFIIKGRAKSAKEVFKTARVCLAPLRFGAGLKGKLFDSMKFGTPSVTTQIGAEGMAYKNQWNGYIEDNNIEFAKKAIFLYCNKNKWRKFQNTGVKLFNKRFSKSKYSKKLISKLDKLLNNADNHRAKNFIGSMLMHHSLKSTKYLGKWIEEKNK